MDFEICQQARSHLWTLKYVIRLFQELRENTLKEILLIIPLNKILLIIPLKMHSISHLGHWHPV